MALFVTGVGLGLVLAAQVGAVATVDLLYATVGLAGVGRLLDGGWTSLALGVASGAILIAIGLRTMLTGFRARAGLESIEDIVLPRRAFLTAVAATALNPLTIALWTVSFPAAAPSSATASAAHVLTLRAGVALGTVSWYCGFSTAVALGRRWAGERLLQTVDVVTGSGLVVFGGLLAYRSLDDR